MVPKGERLGEGCKVGGWDRHIHTVVVQSLSHVLLFSTLWAAAHQASLFLTISQTLPKFMSIELVMASNHLIL